MLDHMLFNLKKCFEVNFNKTEQIFDDRKYVALPPYIKIPTGTEIQGNFDIKLSSGTGLSGVAILSKEITVEVKNTDGEYYGIDLLSPKWTYLKQWNNGTFEESTGIAGSNEIRISDSAFNNFFVRVEDVIPIWGGKNPAIRFISRLCHSARRVVLA